MWIFQPLLKLKSHQNFFFFKIIKSKQQPDFLKKYNRVFLNFLKNNKLFLKQLHSSFSSLHTLHSLLVCLWGKNINMYVYDTTTMYLNTGSLNLAMLGFSNFNKNLFFLFFKLIWLKSDVNKKKFLLFLKTNHVGLIFFFNVSLHSSLKTFFKSFFFLKSGLTTSLKKTFFLDYPVLLESNVLNNYFIYIFFTRLVLTKLSLKKVIFFKKYYFFFPLVGLV